MTRKLLGIALIVGLAVGTGEAGLRMGKRNHDESNGFVVYTPHKWEQVPTKFQDVATVGKWAAPRAKKGYYGSEMYVLRFLAPPQPEDTGEGSPADALKRGMPGYDAVLRDQPKDVWEFVANLLGMPLEAVENDEDFKTSYRGQTCHFRLFQQKAAGGGGRQQEKFQVVVYAAQIKREDQGDSAYGIVFLCTAADQKDSDQTFRTIIKRFKILESEEEDDDPETAVSDADIFVDSTKKPEAWREARRRKLIKGWDAIDTANYMIVYNKEVKRPLLKQIAKHIEAIRSQVYEKLFPPAHEVKAISVVRVCKDAAEYPRYGGPNGSAGYWSRGDEELVFYQDKSNKADSLRVLYHEAFHQYIHYAVGDVAPHSWFNEGHGDYFAGHNYEGGKFNPAPFRWRTGTIATAIGSGTFVPLKQFLKYTQAEYYANPGLCYAQGWSFVYFLREVERRKIKKYKQYWGLLDKYFEAIKRNVQSVREGGLEGLDEPPPKPDGDGGDAAPEEGGDVAASDPATDPATGPEVGGLPRLPGLEAPFPGENPLAGAGAEDRKATGETKTVAGPQITGVGSALDAAVDEAFRGIDYEQLQKDWIEFSK